MEQAQFEQIVTKMEELNSRSPEEYNRKVASFSALGFGVYIGSFSLLLGVLGTIVYMIVNYGFNGVLIKLVLIFGAVTFMFARSMWIKIDPPQGREVTKSEAPALHAEIERIRQEIGAPEIYRVLLIEDFNAFASSSPKFAIFGERCYVALGLPLLLTQKPEEISATIAHELAHHSKKHVKAGSRAYRLERMWFGLLHQLYESGSLLSAPMLAFVKWYSPRYSAMTLVLRRQAEYEADALGAKATSAEAMALGLLRMSVDHKHRLDAYMSTIRKRLHTEEAPPANLYRGMREFRSTDAAGVFETVRRELTLQTVLEDSHPCVRERTEALGISADPEDEQTVRSLVNKLGQVEECAAERFFGERLESILESFDLQWQKERSAGWAESREAIKEAQSELDEFAGRDDGSLDAKEALKKLKASSVVFELKEIAPLAVTFADRFPDEAELQFMAGICYLEADDERGVEKLELTARIDPEWTATVHESIASFRASQGDSHAARAAALKAGELREKETEEFEKMVELLPSDSFVRIEGKDKALYKIIEKLPEMKRITEAHAFRKVSSAYPSLEIDFIVLIVNRPGFTVSDDSLIDQQVKEARKVLGEVDDFYVQIFLDNSPIGKRLLSDVSFRIYS